MAVEAHPSEVVADKQQGGPVILLEEPQRQQWLVVFAFESLPRILDRWETMVEGNYEALLR